LDANNNHSPKSEYFPEAKASWTVKYIDTFGFESMLTLRGDIGLELLEKASSAINYLVEHGCTPYVNYRSSSRYIENKTDENNKEEANNSDKDNPGWCSIHDCQMKKWSKGDNVWFSHKTHEGWCNGK
jgi:hypothetical protein